MTNRDFLRRYRWLPANHDDQLDWIVMVAGAWMAYAVAGLMQLIWR
jgi:hypothetical protein